MGLNEIMWQRAQRLLAPFQAVVFDLDGTLVALEVDWGEVLDEMMNFAVAELRRDFTTRDVWQMLRDTEGSDRKGLERILRRREIAGALRARTLPLADLLPLLGGRQVGVVSLNSRASCETALESADLTRYVDAIVAREDSKRLKPNPEPLLQCIKVLGSVPQASVFIGDRERDRITARRAGTHFVGSQELTP